MAVIELGELSDRPEPQPADRIPRRTVRQLGLVGVLALCLAATASAPQAERPAAVTIPARPEAFAVVRGDVLFVMDTAEVQADGAGSELAAYALPAARPLWRVPLPVAYHGFTRVADVVLLARFGAGDQEFVAISAADGTARWRRSGEPLSVTPQGTILIRTGPPDRDWLLHSVDPRTGADRWTRAVATGEFDWRLRGEAADLMLLTTARRVELRDPDSGDLLRAMALPPPTADQPRSTQFVGDLLLISDGDRMVTAYDVGSLSRRWSRLLDPATESIFLECGDLVCLQGDSGRLQVLDPTTGRTRWQDEDLLIVTAVGDRFLALASDRPGSGDVAILDGPTGQVRRHLGRWHLSAWGWDGPPIGEQRLADGRLLLARLDPTADGVQVIATLPGVVGQCEAPGSVLVCRREGGAYGVWRLDRSP